MVEIARRAVLLGVTAALLLAGCSDSSTGPGRLDGGADGTPGNETGVPIDGATDATPLDAPGDLPVDAPAPDACVPEPVDCNNRCGTLTDKCGGEHACGGCDEGLVCNIETQQCGVPLVTCEDLVAECGTIRNSCGARIACGTCPDGEECDPDTNTCVPCSNVTCADLGRQCGPNWLGCGPETNTTDCGACPDGEVCNQTLHLCEPACTPASTEDTCAAAKLASGVECGFISDGCGGIAGCGDCPEGEGCGVQGVANRCAKLETPLECQVLGRNCGTIESACGGTLDCGTCTEPEICNPNGVCGPPCSPKTCEKDYAGQCGTQLDDGCWGFIDCGCEGDLTCDSTVAGVDGTCKALQTCADYAADGVPGDPCSNEPSPTFPRGDGESLSCPCGGSAVCVDAAKKIVSGADSGTCCLNSSTCKGIGGACTEVDTCTGETIQCCGDDEYCDGAQTCQPIKGCGVLGATGAVGAVCSNDAAFDRGDGTLIACGCADGAVCVAADALVSGTQQGTCCQPNKCDASSGCTEPNGCIATASFNCCGAGEYCDTASDKCLSLGECGNFAGQCSNGPAFDRGDGTLLACPCTGGDVCVSGGAVVSGSEKGACCTPNSCSGDVCSVDNGCVTGETIQCCTANQYCDGGSCKNYKTCADYPGECSNGPAFDRGDGTLMICNCDPGAVCVDSIPGTTVGGANKGVCCNVNSCPSGPDVPCNISNNCLTSGTIACCGPGQYCDGGFCRDYKTCADFAGQCSNGGAFDRGDGTLLSCPCPSPDVCVSGGEAVTGTETGTCCTPGTCAGTTACSVPYGCITGMPDLYCCDTGEYCGPSQTCLGKQNCGSYTTRLINQPCSDMASEAFPIAINDDPPSGYLTCPCRTVGGYSKIKCNGDSATIAGTCECAPDPDCGGDCNKHDTTDGCGGTLSCPCGAGEVCKADGNCCTPMTCGDYPAGTCGSQSNGCGGTITCGCPAGQVCNAGTCCTPETCGDKGSSCGALSDTCGGTITCGCAGGETCYNGTCCPLRSCSYYPDACGTLSNGCGGSITCGCGAGETCHNGSCCTLDTCGQTTGSACGPSVDNGCGGTMSCGCSGTYDSCLGTGVCGCIPDTCGLTVGSPCGSGVDNGCGGTMTCSCTGTRVVCYSGSCCQYASQQDTCAGKTGIQQAGCGQTYDCGG